MIAKERVNVIILVYAVTYNIKYYINMLYRLYETHFKIVIPNILNINKSFYQKVFKSTSYSTKYPSIDDTDDNKLRC